MIENQSSRETTAGFIDFVVYDMLNEQANKCVLNRETSNKRREWHFLANDLILRFRIATIAQQ